MMTNKSLMTYFKAFIVGSSLLSAFLTFAYTGMAFHRSGHSSLNPVTPVALHYEVIPYVVLTIIGLGSVFNVWLRTFMKNKLLGTAIAGALTGLSMSLVGRFKFDLPRKIFGHTTDDAWQVHIKAMILYVGIFLLVIQPLSSLFI